MRHSLGKASGIKFVIQWSHWNVLWSSSARLALGKAMGRSFGCKKDGGKCHVGNVTVFIDKPSSSHLCTSTTSKWLADKKRQLQCGHNKKKKINMDHLTPLYNQVYLGCTPRVAVNNKEHVEARSYDAKVSGEPKQAHEDHEGRILELDCETSRRKAHGKGVVSWPTGLWGNFIKRQHHEWTASISKQMTSKQLVDWPKHARVSSLFRGLAV